MENFATICAITRVAVSDPSVYELFFFESGLWIRNRMNPHPFSLLDPDPDPGGENLKKKNRKMQGKWEKIVILL